MWNVIRNLKADDRVSPKTFNRIVGRWIKIVEEKELISAQTMQTYQNIQLKLETRPASPTVDPQSKLKDLDVQQSWEDLDAALKLKDMDEDDARQ